MKSYYPWCIGLHCTGPLTSPVPLGMYRNPQPHPTPTLTPRHGTLLYRNSQPLPPLPTWDLTIWNPPLLVTSGSHHWRPVQTFSLQDPHPTGSDIWWLLKQVRSLQAGRTHPTGMLSCFFLEILWKTLRCSFFRNLARKKSRHTAGGKSFRHSLIQTHWLRKVKN